VAGDALSSRTRRILGWTALGLYASTRVGILVIGNLHISEFDRYLGIRLTAIEDAGGHAAPALAASTTW
jgi:hypothetical protein